MNYQESKWKLIQSLSLRSSKEKARAIQAFEYCFELSWKIMKRFLQEQGKIANSPKETFRMSTLEGFIQNPEIWFQFLVKRNLIVHAYEEEKANEVISIFSEFSKEITTFKLFNEPSCTLQELLL